MNMLDKLRSVADEISANENALKTQEHWALVARLIGRTPADPAEAKRVVEEQDAAGLHALLDVLQGKATPAPPPTAPEAASEFSTDDINAAIRAFKKRLKLVRLNDESRLSGRLLSGGHASEVDAIQPPSEFPEAMWKTLVAQGRLVDQGGGFYGLPG